MKKVNVGVIGAGVIATTMHIPVLRAMSGVTLAWIMDAQADRATQAAELNGTRAVAADQRSDADIVLLAIPLPPRPALLDRFAGSDTIVFAEKPLANTLAEHDHLANRFSEWQLAVGYQRRYYAQFRLIRTLIASGALGPLRHIRVSEGGRTTRSGGAGDYQMLPIAQGGGIVKNLGCHSLDLALWLTGAQTFDVMSKSLSIDGGADLACEAQVQLNLPAGGSCQLAFAASWIDRMDNMVEFSFDHARLQCSVSPAENVRLVDRQGNVLTTFDARKSGAVTSAQAFYLEWQDVITAALDRQAQPLSATSTRPVAALMAALLDEDKR